jgi:hypothetical protein
MSVAGSIGPKPETVREAVLEALADFARAYNRAAEAASVEIYVRVLDRFLPEAIQRGARSALEEERYFPAPATFRGYVLQEHERLTRARNSVVVAREDDNGRRCADCGAMAYERNGRYVIDHDPHRHGVHTAVRVY